MYYPFKYRVVTECSSNEEAKIDDHGRQVLLETNNYQVARKECIEWAAYDDIQVQVLGRWGQVKFTCDGAYEAETRYPKTVDSLAQRQYN
jgi:hypothetical protein